MLMEEQGRIRFERWKLLVRLEKLLDVPMIVLGFLWFILLVIELTSGLSSTLEIISIGIWVIFILDFLIAFLVAPVKKIFLKRNILTMISLVVPAFRMLRVVRFIRVLRGIRLVKVIGSVNRSIKGLAATISKRGVGYMLLLSLIVVIAGGAGMYAFERDETEGLNDYWEALWFTGMVVITLGSDYWPRSAEGRILCFFLALYGFAVLGYITATLATYFIGKDAVSDPDRMHKSDLSEIKKELSALRELIKSGQDQKK